MDNLWIIYISGWWLTYPSEKYDSQLGWLFPTEWKNRKCSKPPPRQMVMSSRYFIGTLSWYSLICLADWHYWNQLCIQEPHYTQEKPTVHFAVSTVVFMWVLPANNIKQPILYIMGKRWFTSNRQYICGGTLSSNTTLDVYNHRDVPSGVIKHGLLEHGTFNYRWFS